MAGCDYLSKMANGFHHSDYLGCCGAVKWESRWWRALFGLWTYDVESPLIVFCHDLSRNCFRSHLQPPNRSSFCSLSSRYKYLEWKILVPMFEPQSAVFFLVSEFEIHYLSFIILNPKDFPTRTKSIPLITLESASVHTTPAVTFDLRLRYLSCTKLGDQRVRNMRFLASRNCHDPRNKAYICFRTSEILFFWIILSSPFGNNRIAFRRYSGWRGFRQGLFGTLTRPAATLRVQRVHEAVLLF